MRLDQTQYIYICIIQQYWLCINGFFLGKNVSNALMDLITMAPYFAGNYQHKLGVHTCTERKCQWYYYSKVDY